MARRSSGKVVDPTNVEVAWFPDEGAYRTVSRSVETGTVGGADVAVEVVEPGDRLVWIDEAPNDGTDGSGHYEVYNEGRHGDDYRASMPDPAAADDDDEG